MAGREEKKMNILLVGGSCSLMDSMILKLRKEGHRVFLLTGDKYRHNKYQKVFERYDFAYDCENLNDILESVNADVTILMGHLIPITAGMGKKEKPCILFLIW